MSGSQSQELEVNNKHNAALLQKTKQLDAEVQERFDSIRNGASTLRFDETSGAMSKGHAVRSAQAAVVEQLQATRDKLTAQDAKFLEAYINKYQKEGVIYADGAYGADTKKLVTIFQKATGLAENGVIQKETLAAIEKSVGQLGYRSELEKAPLPIEVINQLKAGKPEAQVPAAAKAKATTPAAISADASPPATASNSSQIKITSPSAPAARTTHSQFADQYAKVPLATVNYSNPTQTAPAQKQRVTVGPDEAATSHIPYAKNGNDTRKTTNATAAKATTTADAKVTDDKKEPAPSNCTKPEVVSPQLIQKAKEVWEASRPGFTGWGTESDALLESLKGVTPESMQQLRAVFKEHYDQDMDAVVKAEFSGTLLQEATYRLESKHAEADALKLARAAEQWFGKDQAILETLKDKSAPELATMNATLELYNKPSIKSIIDDNLSGIDLERGNALLTGTLNEFGRNAENDRLTLTSLITDENYAEAFELLESRNPAERQSLLQLDSNDNRLQTAVRNLGENSIYTDRFVGLLSNEPTQALVGEAHIALESGDVRKLFALLEKRGVDVAALNDAYNQRYNEDFSTAAAALINNGRGWGADAGEKILKDPSMIPAYRLEEAMDGFGTDEAVIRDVLANNHFSTLEENFKNLFGTDLRNNLAWELGGRDQINAQRKERGSALSLKEMVDYAVQDAKDDRGLMSRTIYETAEFLTYGAGKGNLLDKNADKLKNTFDNIMSDEIVTEAEYQQLQRELTFVNQDNNSYSEAKDAAANAIGTVAGTAAATAVVVGTAGLATPLVAAGAAGAGAGSYVIAKGATQGANYDFQGILGDGAIGAVDGVFTASGGKIVTTGAGALLNAAKAPIASTSAAFTAASAAMPSIINPTATAIANGAKAVATAVAPIAEPASWIASEAALRSKATVSGVAQNILYSTPVQATINTGATAVGYGASVATKVAESKAVQASVGAARNVAEKTRNVLKPANALAATTATSTTTAAATPTLGVAAKTTFAKEVKQITNEILGPSGINALTTKAGAKELGRNIVEESKQIANEVLGHKVTGAAREIAQRTGAAASTATERVNAVSARIAQNQTLRNSGQFLINNFGDGALGGGSSEAVRAIADGDSLQNVIERSMFGATAGAIGAGAMRGALNGASNLTNRIAARANGATATPLAATLTDEVSNALASAKALGDNMANPPFAAVDDPNFFVSNGLGHRINGIHEKVTQALQNGDLKTAADEILAVRQSPLARELAPYLNELDQALEIAQEQAMPFASTQAPIVVDSTLLDIPAPITGSLNATKSIHDIFEPIKESINDQLAGSTHLDAYFDLLDQVADFAKAGDIASAKQAMTDFQNFGIGSGGTDIRFQLETAINSAETFLDQNPTQIVATTTTTPEIPQATVASSMQEPSSPLAFDPLGDSSFADVTTTVAPKAADRVVATETLTTNNIAPANPDANLAGPTNQSTANPNVINAPYLEPGTNGRPNRIAPQQNIETAIPEVALSNRVAQSPAINDPNVILAPYVAPGTGGRPHVTTPQTPASMPAINQLRENGDAVVSAAKPTAPVAATTNPETLQTRFASAVVPPPPATSQATHSASSLLEQAKAMEKKVGNAAFRASTQQQKLNGFADERLSPLVNINAKWEADGVETVLSGLHTRVSNRIQNGSFDSALKEIEKDNKLILARAEKLFADKAAADQSKYVQGIKSYIDLLKNAVDAARQGN